MSLRQALLSAMYNYYKYIRVKTNRVANLLPRDKTCGMSVAINKKIREAVFRCVWHTPCRDGGDGKTRRKKSHAFDVPAKGMRCDGREGNDEGGGEVGKGEYDVGGGVVLRGLVGRLQPRFCAIPRIPPPTPAYSTSMFHSFSLSLLLSSFLSLSLSLSLCVSLFLYASKTALKRYRKIITGKALHTHACGKPRDPPTELHWY